MLSFGLLLSGDMDPHHWCSARWFSKCDPQSGEQVIFLPLRSWAWRKLFLPWESLETTVMQHWLLVFLPNTSICFTRIFSCARMDPFYLKSLTIFFFFFFYNWIGYQLYFKTELGSCLIFEIFLNQKAEPTQRPLWFYLLPFGVEKLPH